MLSTEEQTQMHQDVDMIFHSILPDYGMTERNEQIKLCHNMLSAMIGWQIALTDAGTGIGKTYAYLVAAVVFHKYLPTNRPIVLSIVSKELFRRVQSEMARRVNRRKAAAMTSGDRVKGKYSAQYALTERLICGECGTPYRRCTWTQNSEKRIVWRCISRLEHGKQYCHKSPTMDEYKLQAAIVDAINRILEDKDEIIQTVTEAIRIAFRGNKDGVNAPALEARRVTLQKEIDELLNLTSEQTADELEARFRKIVEEQESITRTLAEHDRECAAEECENARLHAIIQTIQETPCALTEYDDTLVRRIVDSVIVDSKDQITVSFGYGVSISVQIA